MTDQDDSRPARPDKTAIYGPFSGVAGKNLVSAYMNQDNGHITLEFEGHVQIEITPDCCCSSNDLLAVRKSLVIGNWMPLSMEQPLPTESVWWYFPEGAGFCAENKTEAVTAFGSMIEYSDSWDQASFYCRAPHDKCPPLGEHMTPMPEKRKPAHKRDPWEYGENMNIRKPGNL